MCSAVRRALDFDIANLRKINRTANRCICSAGVKIFSPERNPIHFGKKKQKAERIQAI